MEGGIFPLEMEKEKRGEREGGWEKALLTAATADTSGRGGGADREERTELLAPRGLEMKEPNPERGDNSFVNRTRQLNPARCTRARFRRMGGALRGNSRPRRVSITYLSSSSIPSIIFFENLREFSFLQIGQLFMKKRKLNRSRIFLSPFLKNASSFFSLDFVRFGHTNFVYFNIYQLIL